MLRTLLHKIICKKYYKCEVKSKVLSLVLNTDTVCLSDPDWELVTKNRGLRAKGSGPTLLFETLEPWFDYKVL